MSSQGFLYPALIWEKEMVEFEEIYFVFLGWTVFLWKYSTKI